MKKILLQNKIILISIMIMTVSILWSCTLLTKGINSNKITTLDFIQYVIICILALVSINIIKRGDL